MKKFKDIIALLESGESEDGGGFGDPFQPTRTTRSAASDFGVHRIENDTQLNRVKAFLSSFSGREYLEPRGALSLLRAKMNIMGLDFDFTPKTKLIPGPNVFPLNRFGGTFGTTPEHDLLKDGFLTTDGISEFNNGKGLNLILDIQMTPNNLYKFDFSVVPN
jgi:hypothetical protein